MKTLFAAGLIFLCAAACASTKGGLNVYNNSALLKGETAQNLG